MCQSLYPGNMYSEYKYTLLCDLSGTFWKDLRLKARDLLCINITF